MLPPFPTTGNAEDGLVTEASKLETVARAIQPHRIDKSVFQKQDYVVDKTDVGALFQRFQRGAAVIVNSGDRNLLDDFLAVNYIWNLRYRPEWIPETTFKAILASITVDKARLSDYQKTICHGLANEMAATNGIQPRVCHSLEVFELWGLFRCLSLTLPQNLIHQPDRRTFLRSTVDPFLLSTFPPLGPNGGQPEYEVQWGGRCAHFAQQPSVVTMTRSAHDSYYRESVESEVTIFRGGYSLGFVSVLPPIEEDPWDDDTRADKYLREQWNLTRTCKVAIDYHLSLGAGITKIAAVLIFGCNLELFTMQYQHGIYHWRKVMKAYLPVDRNEGDKVASCWEVFKTLKQVLGEMNVTQPAVDLTMPQVSHLKTRQRSVLCATSTLPSPPRTMLDLPPEILQLILRDLSKHDLTVCVRVNKAWYNWFIDNLWHMIDLTSSNTRVTNHFRPLRGFGFIMNFVDNNANENEKGEQQEKHAMRAIVLASFIRLRHKIRVLKVTYTSQLNIFAFKSLDANIKVDNKSIDPKLALEELEIGFWDDPFLFFIELFCLPICGTTPHFDVADIPSSSRRPFDAQALSSPAQIAVPPPIPTLPSSDSVPGFTFGASASALGGSPLRTPSPFGGIQPMPWVPPSQLPTDIEPLLLILRRSPNLLRLHAVFGELSNKGQQEDEGRILAALPPSLRELSLNFQAKPRSDQLKTPHMDEATKAAILARFSSLSTTGPLPNLKILTICGLREVVPYLEHLLLERCSVLEELNLSCPSDCLDDAQVARVIALGGHSPSKVGWKTLGFLPMCGNIGPLTVAAILEHAACTLENLRISDCKSFNSHAIQRLLCSAPKLKRLDTIAEYVHDELDPYSLMAKDIVHSSKPWVCLGLESFKCFIAGVPRPDIQEKSNGRPLSKHEFHDRERNTTRQSRIFQERVLAQLGKLTKLREITLGSDTINRENYETYCDETAMEGKYFDNSDYVENSDFQLGRQYECLSLTLEHGLDELRNLKSLRRLRVRRMEHRMGEVEKKWIKTHWPDYCKKSRDAFWTSRGHVVEIATDIFDEDKELNDGDEEFDEDLQTYDHW
ncbi:hypothetical protein BGZ83_011588 [Gryganskiella cystojenkinii]|nr:hypothetical protein BGZ83_011588 [Gryganskiella cystojenkinii]